PGQAVATGPLLETKLYIPKWRPGLVSRPRLIERLNQGIERKLTLISAPAGSGKTTLLAEWLAATPASERPAAWFSLDQSDNDPALFWSYFITALQKIQSEVGERALSLLHSPQPPPIESVLTTLINEITAVSHDFVLVLDDYHVIDAQPVHSAVAFLLDHLPPQMHLVIASRSDPPLPLARLRARGESTELRASDLRFTPDEAAAFLNDVMGLDLSAADVAALETRTEGWIAGLQLAALSMQGRDDVPGFIATFSGDDRYIVDYLVEEVLQRQPKNTRSFLLQTSILDRLSGPLCDAVTGQEDGKGMLETLERGNLFVVPLDDKRDWYRYHRLFADVLHAHLIEEQPDLVPTLHRRASDWYEQNGSPSDAVRHALAAEDFERAAGLIELAWPAMNRSFQYPTWLGWIKALPDELVRVRPVLSTGYAWALLFRGELEAADARLRDAERWLNATSDMTERPQTASDDMVVVDEEEFRLLPATIASARTFIAQALGDVPGVVKYAQRALDLLPERDYFRRAIPTGVLALAYWASGDLEAAHRSLADSRANMRKAGNILSAISGAAIEADIEMTQGHLHEAVSTYERSLQLAAEQGEPVLQGTADLLLGLSELLLEQGDLEAATQRLLTSEELGEQAAQEAYQYRSRVARARMKEVQGDLTGALDLLDEAERVYTVGVIPDLRPVAALKTRVWVRQGRLTEALDWVRGRGLSADDDLSYLGEFEHITLARVLIALYKSDGEERSIHEAMRLLERLLNAAEEGGRTGSVIEMLVLQALAHEAQSDIAPALVPLERALTLAEPEGYVRIFVDEGEPMRNLLRHATADGIASSYTRRLLSALDEPDQPAPTATHAAADLAERLTGREVEILRLIAAGMRNQEIADQLFISLPTVKRHVANAYGKLGVSHRTEAVARANELNLL
ncbi:MAG: LuxR C-terminal-related transcriptional regulator, partial [Nitrospirota bacterium]|nr:LuxR C-terminal-related transcriptional regulator [Nitrospirota bacterium]